jgi:peptide/nickel transport system substrate-binding protein
MKAAGRLLLVLALLASCRRAPEPTPPPPPARRPAPPAAFQGDVLPPVVEQGTPMDGGTLRVALEAEPPSLNYQLDPLDNWAKKIDQLVYDSLARPDPVSFQHQPRLAERWDVSPDGLTYTFHLRHGVRWHDGRPFSADDVVFTFEVLRDVRSKTVSIRSFLEPLSRCEAVDPYTVRFTFARPYWMALDVAGEILIYPRHVYARGDFNTHPANRAPVGTGPFRFVRWATGSAISLQRNDAYWGEKPRLERIEFVYVPDPNVRLQLLTRGELDVIERVTPEAWARVTPDPEVARRFWRLRHVPSSLQWIGWNEARALFADSRVRRALTMLIDRDDVVNGLRLGLDRVAGSWFYPGAPEHDPSLAPLPYDPRAAEAMLDEAGWKRGPDGVRAKDGVRASFTFLYPAGSAFYEQLAAVLRVDLEQAGLEVQAARLEWAVFTERLRKHEFDACSLLWQMDPRSDPYQIWHSSAVDGGSNYIGFKSVALDALLEQARAELDPGKRAALYRQLSVVLRDEQPYTLLFNRYNLSLVSKTLGGIRSTPYGILAYGELYRVGPIEAAKP